LNCASLLKRLELSWEECQQIAPEVATKMVGPENLVTNQIRGIVKKALQMDGSLFKPVMAKSKQKRDILQEYMTQEGVLDGSAGMVDLGWNGRIRASLERSLNSETTSNLHWFYLGINYRTKIYDLNRVHYFLYGTEVRRQEIPFLPAVVESFCLAPHGSVTGYRHDGGRIVPLFRDSIEKELDDWGRHQIFATIQDYLQNFQVQDGQFPNIGNLVGAAQELLTDFCTNPSAEDAKLWGATPFEHDQAAKMSFPLAPEARVSKANLKNALIFGSVHRACMGEAEGAWGAGSWAARQKPLYLLTLAAWVGYLRINWRKLPQRTVYKFRRTLSHLRHS
jgi:hypothetical protein